MSWVTILAGKKHEHEIFPPHTWDILWGICLQYAPRWCPSSREIVFSFVGRGLQNWRQRLHHLQYREAKD